jgi:cellulose synthase/poly-beta-1,6-N-acetylglucosamine synthase-like glycosyltransferase
MIASLFWLSVTSIVYAYVGYPLILAILARTRLDKQGDSGVTPFVTLLIAAYNEEATIAEKLENSLALDYPRHRLQILVAADGSDDRTVDIVRSYAGRGVELSYSGPRRGKMAAINRAMDQVIGDVVLFSDANNLYEPNAVREIVKPFADPQVGAVSGAKIIIQGDGALGESEGLYWKYESFIKQQETRLGSCVGVAGEVLAVRHGLFEAPPNYIINDDFYVAMRVIQRDYRVVYTPQARSYERVSPSAQDEMDRRARIVAGRYQALALAYRLLPLRRPIIAWQVISHKFLRPLVPLAMVGALITNVIAVFDPAPPAVPSLSHLTPPFGWLLLLAQVVFYGLAWVGGHIAQRSKLFYLPTFLLNSNLAAVMGLVRFLTRQQTSLWQRVPRRRLQRPLPLHEEGEV